MLGVSAARPLTQSSARADVCMPWKRSPTEKARRRKIKRRLWFIAAVLLVFLAAALLIWICTAWTTDPALKEGGGLLPGWQGP